MTSDPSGFLRACMANGFIVDANLFLLLAFDTTHKYTHGLEEELLITRSVTGYCSEKGAKLILTPHIIAEISNMLINRGKKFNFTGDANFITLTKFLKESLEHPVPKDLILGNSHLAYIGFTDLSIIEAAKEKGFGVLTIDNELFCRLTDEGCYAINPRIIANTKTLQLLIP